MGWQPTQEDEWDSDQIYFSRGSREELDRLVWSAMLTEPADKIRAAVAAEQHITIYTAHKSKATIRKNDSAHDKWHSQNLSLYATQRICKLVGMFLEENQPTGYVLSYNDKSTGYVKTPVIIQYKVTKLPQVSARERMNIAGDLSQWLATRGHDPRDFGFQQLTQTPVILQIPSQPTAYSKTPSIEIECRGGFALLPFDLVRELDVITNLTHDQTRMSFSHVYIRRYDNPVFTEYNGARISLPFGLRTPISKNTPLAHTVPWIRVSNALSERGIPFSLKFTYTSVNGRALVKYDPELVLHPLQHGDIVRISDTGQTALLIWSNGEFRFAGYRDRNVRQHILERIKRANPDSVRLGHPSPPTDKKPTEIKRICCGGIEPPSDALLSYLKTHKAVKLEASETITMGTRLNWGYAFEGTYATYRRLSGMAHNIYKRHSSQLVRKAKFNEITYASNMRISPSPTT